MPKAVKGTSLPPYLPYPHPPRQPATRIQKTQLKQTPPPPTGVLVECDPSIKAIILKIDQEKHDYIVEDLDDQTLVIKESQLQKLKARLEEVSRAFVYIFHLGFVLGVKGAKREKRKQVLTEAWC